MCYKSVTDIWSFNDSDNCDGKLRCRIWKLGQDLFTNMFTPQTGLDKAVPSQMY